MKSVAILKAAMFIFMASGSAFSAPEESMIASPPIPFHLNLTELLTLTGPYHKFLSLLQSTNLTDTLQNQANNAGITIFVPDNDAFANLHKPSISNLTGDQLKSLLLFHVLPKFYTFDNFTELSKLSPVETFAGGAYKLNITDNYGNIRIYSGWSVAKITSSVLSTSPAAVYRIDCVLLPEAIFGPAPAPPSPASAPAPGLPAPVSAPAPGLPAPAPAPAPGLSTIPPAPAPNTKTNSSDVAPPSQSSLPAPPEGGDGGDAGSPPESPTPSSAAGHPGFWVLGALSFFLCW